MVSVGLAVPGLMPVGRFADLPICGFADLRICRLVYWPIASCHCSRGPRRKADTRLHPSPANRGPGACIGGPRSACQAAQAGRFRPMAELTGLFALAGAGDAPAFGRIRVEMFAACHLQRHAADEAQEALVHQGLGVEQAWRLMHTQSGAGDRQQLGVEQGVGLLGRATVTGMGLLHRAASRHRSTPAGHSGRRTAYPANELRITPFHE